MICELSERELFEAIHSAKSIDDETGAKIIEQFQAEQTALAEIIFGIFSGILAEEKMDRLTAPCHLNQAMNGEDSFRLAVGGRVKTRRWRHL
jgi:hypothetical protein